MALRPSDTSVAALCRQLLSAGAGKSVVLAGQEEVSESSTDLASHAGDVQVSPDPFCKGLAAGPDFDNSSKDSVARILPT